MTVQDCSVDEQYDVLKAPGALKVHGDTGGLPLDQLGSPRPGYIPRRKQLRKRDRLPRDGNAVILGRLDIRYTRLRLDYAFAAIVRIHFNKKSPAACECEFPG